MFRRWHSLCFATTSISPGLDFWGIPAFFCTACLAQPLRCTALDCAFFGSQGRLATIHDFYGVSRAFHPAVTGRVPTTDPVGLSDILPVFGLEILSFRAVDDGSERNPGDQAPVRRNRRPDLHLNPTHVNDLRPLRHHPLGDTTPCTGSNTGAGLIRILRLG